MLAALSKYNAERWRYAARFSLLFASIAFSLAVSASVVVAAEESGHEVEPLIGLRGDLALWSLVVFIVFVLVLKKFAWGPLSDGLNKREENIRGSIREAEEARIKAEKMLAEHAKKLDSVQDEVREILAEARRDADYTKQGIVETAQREAETTRQRAVDEISRARDAALKELFDVVSTQVANATEHVLSHSLNEDDQNRLIEEALSQFPKN